jgi:hypothetical protein
MKKIINFVSTMGNSMQTSELINYDGQSSNSNNYSSILSPRPESFPSLMENGIIVNYQTMFFTSEIMDEETNVIEEKSI